ncbi:hypothetical protein ARMGADRAFT_1086873 [Armillaria gallica]|uniref:Uncharacterized protein n=1 Tax=Armillaria gallica TaxID=47427 RepID=A0A2H3DCZ3_ARMGA|nr:hypothetical protein ARMGADRAFT_1086873 [Armillaria gallica]
MAVIDIELRTRRTYRLASLWLAGSPLLPKIQTTFIGSPGIWSALTNRDITLQQKCSEWSPKGVILTGVKLNTDAESEASVTVSLSQGIVLLHLDNHEILDEIHSIDTGLHPVTLATDGRAHLDGVGDAQHDHCLQVVFTPPTILIVRAHSITLYDSTFTPIARHSFGWVDGTSATPTSILVRSHSDNPWSSELNSLKLYSLSSFPPTLTSKASSQCRALPCTDAIVGKQATAIWIHPHDRTMVSHCEEYDGCEMLIATVVPAPLNSSAEVRVREVCMNTLNSWTALDYDEILGGSPLGRRLGILPLFSCKRNIHTLLV